MCAKSTNLSSMAAYACILLYTLGTVCCQDKYPKKEACSYLVWLAMTIGKQSPPQAASLLLPVYFFLFFKESLITFSLSRLWRWTAAPRLPRVASRLSTEFIYTTIAPLYTSPTLLNEFYHPLAPFLILPHLLCRPPSAVPHPRVTLKVCRILSCPSVTHTPLIAHLLPEWLPLLWTPLQIS